MKATKLKNPEHVSGYILLLFCCKWWFLNLARGVDSFVFKMSFLASVLNVFKHAICITYQDLVWQSCLQSLRSKLLVLLPCIKGKMIHFMQDNKIPNYSILVPCVENRYTSNL